MKTHFLFIVLMLFIFSCNKKEEPYYSEISGTVYDSLSMSVIQNGIINIVEKTKPEAIILSQNTDAIGNYKLTHVKPFVDYYLVCTKDNYVSKNIPINLNPGELKEKCDVYLIKTYAEIYGTLYDTTNVSIIKYGKIVLVEKANPTIVIDSAYTNETGTFYLSKAKPYIDYYLICKKENYFSKTISLKLNAGEQLVNVAYLKKPSISITQPTKATIWTVGTTDTIRWSDNFPGNVKLDLYKAGVFVQIIAHNTPANTPYIWTIPVGIEGSRPDYSIKISSVIQPEINIKSDNFAIIETTVSDIDGNTYNTVTIGTQVWLRENLVVTHYYDGTDIPLVTDDAAWADLTTGAYCWLENDYQTYGVTYGALYNWHSVNTGKLCPAGWHVPTDEEWTVLTGFVGGDPAAGDKLKEAGFTHWLYYNKGATNQTIFTALPGGQRGFRGGFGSIGYLGDWWSSDQAGTTNAWDREMDYYSDWVTRKFTNKSYGLSVRCLRDY